MANITASMVKDLRDKTGAGMMDCKNALTETGGDMEAAIDWLRKKGISKAAKKAGRAAAEGLVGVAVDANTGVLLEVNAETDFVARNEEFKTFVKDASKLALKEGGDLEKLLAHADGFVHRAADPDRTGRQDRREHVGAPRRRAVGQSRRGRRLCPQCRLARTGQYRRAGGPEVHRRQGQAGGPGQAARHACRRRRAAGADQGASRQGRGRARIQCPEGHRAAVRQARSRRREDDGRPHAQILRRRWC